MAYVSLAYLLSTFTQSTVHSRTSKSALQAMCSPAKHSASTCGRKATRLSLSPASLNAVPWPSRLPLQSYSHQAINCRVEIPKCKGNSFHHYNVGVIMALRQDEKDKSFTTYPEPRLDSFLSKSIGQRKERRHWRLIYMAHIRSARKPSNSSKTRSCALCKPV